MAYLEDVPKYAFGTAYELGEAEGQTSEPELRRLIERAIKLGCRHFDCAPLYKTQHIVGSVIREFTGPTSSPPAAPTPQAPAPPAPAPPTIGREEFFIASKLPVNMMRPEHVDRCIAMILEELQLSYLDLFLIHAPFATQHTEDHTIYPRDQEGNLLLDEEEGLLERAWEKLHDLKRRGLVRYIGLCNVNLEQLFRLNRLHHVDVVQNEYHIYNQDRTIFDFCEELDVHFEAYAAFGSPLKAKEDGKPCFLTDPTVNRVARENKLTVAQVNIQWIHLQPLSYVIKVDNCLQLEENLNSISKVKVSLDDMIELDSLNKNVRIYYFDEHKGITKHREYPFREPTRLIGNQLDPCQCNHKFSSACRNHCSSLSYTQ